jgi:hypothetical protein
MSDTMREQTLSDAPIWLTNEEAAAWADGYNTALAARDAEIAKLREENEPDAWLAEVFFHGCWGAPRVFQREHDARVYAETWYSADRIVRIVPLYRLAPEPEEGV